jgi:hypothetical protein
MLILFSFVKKESTCAIASFVFDNEQSKTFLQIEIKNNSAKDIYLYYPTFNVIREYQNKKDTTSLTALWGNEYVGDIKTFIFERQDSLILKLRKAVRNNEEYKTSKWDNPVWASESDELMSKHIPILHFIKGNKSIILRFYIGKKIQKGIYKIVFTPRNNDEMYKYLPVNFDGFNLYRGNIYLKDFSFIVE